MKTFCWTIIITSLGCWQMLAGDLLWEKLTAHKIDGISVIYMSELITTRTRPSADTLKQSYTHSFVDRHPLEQDPFYQSLKKLLSSSQPVGPIKPAGTGDFRWCVTVMSSDSMMNSTTEIYIYRGQRNSVARIESEFYKLDDQASKQFFDQFAKPFGLR